MTSAEGRRAARRPAVLLFLAPGDVGKGRVEPISWMRTCLAFADRQLDVSLVTLTIRRPDAISPDRVWEHFGVPPRFKIHRLPTGLHRDSSVAAFRSWGGAAAVAVAVRTMLGQVLRPRRLIVYGRTPVMMAPFVLLRALLPRGRRPLVVFETHTLPEGRGSSVARRADLVVVNSRKLGVDLEQRNGIPRARILLAPLGPFNEIRRYPRSSARTQLGLPEDAVIACYSGKMIEEQNEFLLQTASELQRLLPACRLLLVGGNPAIDAWTKRRVAELGLEGTVVAVGFVEPSRVQLYQAAADVLVFHMSDALPHFRYCTPAKGYEYQAAGRPIAATDIPLFDEVFGSHLDRAVKADERTPPALARAIHEALSLDDGGRAMTERALRWVDGRSWQGRADAVLHALDVR